MNITQKSNLLNIPNEIFKINERKVVLSDLDIVNHVNNTKYLEWCLDSLPFTSVLNQQINALEMNFLRELNWNDSIEIHSNASQDFFSVTKGGKICFALALD